MCKGKGPSLCGPIIWVILLFRTVSEDEIEEVEVLGIWSIFFFYFTHFYWYILVIWILVFILSFLYIQITYVFSFHHSLSQFHHFQGFNGYNIFLSYLFTLQPAKLPFFTPQFFPSAIQWQSFFCFLVIVFRFSILHTEFHCEYANLPSYLGFRRAPFSTHPHQYLSRFLYS